MGRVLIYFGRFALIFLAYVCACLAASAFLHVISFGAIGLTMDDAPEIARGSLVFSVPVVALLVSYFAFLPSVPAILMSEAFGWRDWLYYAVGGAVIAAIAIFLLAGASSPSSEFGTPGFWAAMIGAGIVGGIAYWLVAGRLAGNWRARARPPRVEENA